MNNIIAAALIALGILLAGSLPWGALAAWNQRVGIAWPWALLPMLLYLAVYWRVISGRWAPRHLSVQARSLLRANPLPSRRWPLALGSGLCGFAALLALLAVYARLTIMPEATPITMPAGMPLFTVLALLTMQSGVAGVTEEAAFRGYMQSLIEPRHCIVVAIIANGLWFGLLHFSNHPHYVLVMLPYYVSVAAVYGALTWAVNSILPALVLHVIGDIVVLTRWWWTGLPEWRLSAEPLPLVWQSGIDIAFMVAVLVLVLFSALTAAGYRYLRRQLTKSGVA